MPKSIFISYRRSDSADIAGRIFDSLDRQFPGAVFMDVEGGITAGSKFTDTLAEALASCKVGLVLIGPHWITAANDSGRRLDNSQDHVRGEVVRLLRNAELVIPVLVGGAEMPAPAELPEVIRDLSLRQAERITASGFRADVERLCGHIRPATTGKRPATTNRRRLLVGLGAATASGAAVATAWRMYPTLAIAPPTLVRTLDHPGMVESVFFSNDGNSVFAVGQSTLNKWDVATGQKLNTWSNNRTDAGARIEPFGFQYAARIPNGDRMVVSGGPYLYMFDPELPTSPNTKKMDRTARMVVSPNGQIIAGTYDTDGEITIWDAGTSSKVNTLKGHVGRINSLCFHPTSDALISGGADHKINVWDMKTGRIIRQLLGYTGSVQNLCCAPNGRNVGSQGFFEISNGTQDVALKLWDFESGREIYSIAYGFRNQGGCLAFTPNGKYIVGGDETIRVWHAETGREVAILTGHTGRVSSLAFSLDHKFMLSGGWDNSARIWIMNQVA